MSVREYPVDPVQVAADALQKAYGDATQTVLDLQAASAVVHALTASMVMVPSWVLAAVVHAAGGCVRVEDVWVVKQNPPDMTIWIGEMDQYMKIETKRRA